MSGEPSSSSHSSAPSAVQNEISESEFLTPGVREQVRGHLILGPIVRWNLKLSTVWLVAGIVAAVVSVASKHFTALLGLSFVYWLPYLAVRKLSSELQATCLWYGLKGAGLMAGFILSTVGAMSTLMWHGTPTDALVVLVTGLAIIPGLEFIPRLIPHQKWITLGRIVILLGCFAYALPSLMEGGAS